MQPRKYRTIVADPPWPIGNFPAWYDEDRRSKREREMGANPTPYETMSLEDIKAMPVRSMSDHLDYDAHLYLWTTDQFLLPAHDVARAWGFHPSATIIWCKPPMGVGMGGIWPSNVEFVLFCRRPKLTNRHDVVLVTSQIADAAETAGITLRQVNEHMGYAAMAMWWLSRDEYRCACPTDEQWPRLRDFLGMDQALDAEVARINAAKGTSAATRLTRAPSRWFQWPRGKHSQKPEAFLDLVEQVSPGPYVELFARRDRLGWDTWGDESLGTAEMAG